MNARPQVLAVWHELASRPATCRCARPGHDRWTPGTSRTAPCRISYSHLLEL